MRQLKRMLSVVLGSLAVSFGALAADCSKPGVRIIYTEECGPVTSQVRQAYARDLLARMEALLKQVPTLSPAEAAWLKVEYDDQPKDIYTPRLLAAMSSVEFQKRQARTFLETQINLLRVLTEPSNLEVYYWSLVATNFGDLDSHQAIHSLVESGLVSRETSMYYTAMDEDVFRTYYPYLQQGFTAHLMRHVVLPMMR